MLHARHVGSRRFNRNITASIDRHVNNVLKSSLWQIPQPQSSCPASGSQRSLHLASTAPIVFPSRDAISIHLKDGKHLMQKFSPTPKASLDKLREALTELLQSPDTPPLPIEYPNWRGEKKDIPGLSFGTSEWFLDPEGDAIHRHTAHARVSDLDVIEKLITRRADEMGHHPHITRGKTQAGEDTFMTITCTTHSPRGLSVRDMRLARAINEILSEFNTTTAPTLDTSQNLDDDRLKIAAQRARMVAINREKINKALESCGCETAKSKPQPPPRQGGE